MPRASVCVRVRPADGEKGAAGSVAKGTPGHYQVDSIIDAASSSPAELFTTCVSTAVDELLEGNSSCLLVYGAPATGKTYALEGANPVTGHAAGLVPRAANAIFGHLRPVPRDKFLLQATLSGLTSKQDACVVDLLDPHATSIALREYNIAVATSHLTVMPLDSMDDVHQFLRRKAIPTAPSTPHAADPNSNQHAFSDSLSRRALNQLGPMHVMYSLHLITRPGDPDEQVSTLTFVELIGQESKASALLLVFSLVEDEEDRAAWDTYGLRSPRNDEALQRQLSRTYSALTSVLLALRSISPTAHSMNPSDPQPCPPSCAPPGLIPWRDSPLTKWLQPVLVTAAVLVILATVSPNPDDVQDTMATLSYVSRLRPTAVTFPSALAVPPSMEASASMHAASTGKMITVSPSWAARCYSSGASSKNLNPSNLKLTGSFGNGPGVHGNGVGAPRPTGRPRSVQVFGKQRLPQRPQSIGAGWDRSHVLGKSHMHGYGNRSSSATPRGNIHSTGSSPAALASAFSAPVDTLSAYPHSPAAAQHGSLFHLSHTVDGMHGSSFTPNAGGGGGSHTPHMHVHHRSDSMPSAMSALRVHTTAARGGGDDAPQAPHGGASSPSLHHNTLQSIATAPWSPMHDACGHQDPDLYHPSSGKSLAVAFDSGNRAVAFDFAPHGNTAAHGNSGSPRGRSLSPGRGPEVAMAAAAGAQIDEEDSRRFGELQAALRRRGVGVREEAQLAQLLENLHAARAEAADFTSFRTRAAQQQRALEAQVADARQDRSAAVAVIEGLQRELREARCECAALVDQRRYFEERALATSAATQQNLPSDSTYAAHASGPDAATEGAQVQGGPELAQAATTGDARYQDYHTIGGVEVDVRNGEATAALDVGPGWVPVQEVLDARAQASDARAEAFESAQRAQGLEAGSREGLRQLRERVHALATSMAVQVMLDTKACSSASSDVHGGSASLAEAMSLAETLGSVQHETERLKAAETAAQKLASDLQATSGPAAVANAQATADSAAAEVALERSKARDISVVVTDLREQLASAQQRHASASAAAQEAEKHGEELAVRAQGLEESVQRLEVAAKAVSERTAVERSAQEETHQRELSEQQNCATDAAARVHALHSDLGATQEQVAELHSLNEALAHDLSSKGKALEDSESSLENARSRCSAAEQQLVSTSSLINELQQELAHTREADRVHSMDATQHAEAAAQLRCQRDCLQDRLAAAQGTLGSTAAEVETLWAQVASRDTMLNHAWSLICTIRRVLVPSDSTAPASAPDSAASAECPAMNWSGAGQAEVLAAATKEAMSAVQHAVAELVASADARAAVGLLRKAQGDASATEQHLQGELERRGAELAEARSSQENAANALSAREQELQQMSQHASSSEASAKELSKAHAAADLARAAAEQTAAEANAAATAMQADLDQCRHILQARDMQVQQLASQCQEALHRLAVCEGEMSALVHQLEASGGRVATTEAAAQEARLRAQQLEAAAATAQETVERMQTANQDLITTHSEKERAAAVEESRLQADLEQLRTEATATARRLQDLEARASNGDAAVAEAQTLRGEAAAVTSAMTDTERKLKESENALQCARDELEMVQDKLRQAEEDQKEATAAADRMQKELAAAAVTRRAIDASFQRLDKARERTHAALSRPQSRTGDASPSPIPTSSAAAVLSHGSHGAAATLFSPRSARSALSNSAVAPRASSLGPVCAIDCSVERGRVDAAPGGAVGGLRGPGFGQSDAGALSRELSRRESGWRERVMGRGEGVRWKHSQQGGGGERDSGFRQSPSFRQSPNLSGASAGQEMSFAERMAASMQRQ